MSNIFSNSSWIIIYVVGIFAFMYFVTIRPQQKQQKIRQAMLNSLRVKDKVLTQGGIYGIITRVKEDSVRLQIADKVEVEVARSGITSVENRKIEAEEPKGKKDKVREKAAESGEESK